MHAWTLHSKKYAYSSLSYNAIAGYCYNLLWMLSHLIYLVTINNINSSIFHHKKYIGDRRENMHIDINVALKL